MPLELCRAGTESETPDMELCKATSFRRTSISDAPQSFQVCFCVTEFLNNSSELEYFIKRSIRFRANPKIQALKYQIHLKNMK
jgi:hypothetical protein